MNESEVVDLLFGGLSHLAPGDDALTRAMVESVVLPRNAIIVDAGCGTGRQTLVIASALNQTVHAVDTHVPFLQTLMCRSRAADLDSLIETHALDMAELARRWPRIDLLCAEGSAYSVGFERALSEWRALIAPSGTLIVSELCWLESDPPARAVEFFAREYPAMRSREDVLALASTLGYAIADSVVLPETAWREGYYDALASRVADLVHHDDEAVRACAASVGEEIAVFDECGASYGYLLMRLVSDQVSET